MPTVHHNKRAEPPFDPKLRGLVRNRDLKTLLEDIYERLRLKVSVDGGISAQEIDGGFHLRIDDPIQASELPFFVEYYPGGNTPGSSYNYRARPGSFNSLPAGELAGNPGDAGTGWLWCGSTTATTAHVYLRLYYTLTATSSGYVYETTLNEAKLITASAAQSSPLGPSSDYFYVLLASFTGGVTKTGQYVTTSLTGEVCDDGSGTSKGIMTTYQS